ncbi:unnamed protein product (macronuclear) [Paramecium tetraurelia]|uniref:MORN repeat protein n=1 Tax=Paramecium tetraurelia TaxID=5888 RepID=A0D3F7_PARTE|nr:uncharacterized protein GSPATT00013060001 [Paramecium tetraurelia]CAK77574.1 unnamed protein product [Paramecium tetraurelia]|eukprot:XP_001444971.1 hypothetical protein (macronuclear) [Paramecium tetraurelia strain d4-2]
MQNQQKLTHVENLNNIFSKNSNQQVDKHYLANDENPQQFAIRSSNDIRLQEALNKMQQKQIRQLYLDIGPIYDIDENYETRNFQDGSCYFGQLMNDQKSGTGIMVWSDVGNILDGFWVNNELNGFCRMIYSNEDIFQCNFKFGKANGFGLFQNKVKVVKGLWTNNVLNGEGQEIRSDGQKYYGQFKDGQKNGKGIIFYKDGCKYEGEISRNKINGKGILVWNDSSYYEGEFRNGIINGSGVYVSGNGKSLSGYFEEISNKDRIQRIQCINNNGSENLIEKIRQL